uniref:Putative secreted protein n=1 Tax=Anopheles darlingi TaxID=43151 RepID=A0A2M4D905_ANODA
MLAASVRCCCCCCWCWWTMFSMLFSSIIRSCGGCEEAAMCVGTITIVCCPVVAPPLCCNSCSSTGDRLIPDGDTSRGTQLKSPPPSLSMLSSDISTLDVLVRRR